MKRRNLRNEITISRMVLFELGVSAIVFKQTNPSYTLFIDFRTFNLFIRFQEINKIKKSKIHF